MNIQLKDTKLFLSIVYRVATLPEILEKPGISNKKPG